MAVAGAEPPGWDIPPLYLVPEGRLFVWPTHQIGQVVPVPGCTHGRKPADPPVTIQVREAKPSCFPTQQRNGHFTKTCSGQTKTTPEKRSFHGADNQHFAACLPDPQLSLRGRGKTKRLLLRHFILKRIVLRRQARDKHRSKLYKKRRFSQATEIVEETMSISDDMCAHPVTQYFTPIHA